jgi:DNA modification methylase
VSISCYRCNSWPCECADGCCIVHGDATAVLPLLGSVDVAVTDPPYGIAGGTGGQQHDYQKSNYGGEWKDDGDYIARVVVPIIETCRVMASAVALTTGTANMMQYPQPDDIGAFWCPAAPRLSKWGFTTFHPILYYGKYWRAGRGNWPNGREMNEAAVKNGHPCPKPIGAWKWLVEKVAPPDAIILDPFLGSGTTLRAAKDLGRRAIGIEIEEKYCEIAAKRLEQGVLQFAEAAK